MLFAEADYRFFKQLKNQGYAPKVIYDIGASNGYWSVRIHEALGGGTFHMFEPLADAMPDYRRLLDTAMAQNPDLKLHPVALGTHNRMQSMAIYPDGFGSSLLNAMPMAILQRLRPRPTGMTDLKSLQVRRLDDYIAEHGLAAPDVMKLDVQGYELKILEGASTALQTAKILLVECWLTRGYGRSTPLLHEVKAWMQKRDFVLVDFGETFYGDTHDLSAVDAYFMHKSLAQDKRYSWTIWQ
jgi:FkbM family methyltransferase